MKEHKKEEKKKEGDKKLKEMKGKKE